MLALRRVAARSLLGARSCSSVNESAVIGDIIETVTAAAQKEVPWFLNEMPSAYFRQVPPALRQSHLRAITALSAQGISVPEVKLANADGRGLTFISDGQAGARNQLVERQLASLSSDVGLNRVLLFGSNDGRLGLSVYETYDVEQGSDARMFGAAGADTPTAAAEAEARETFSEYVARLASDATFAQEEAAKAASDSMGAFCASAGGGGVGLDDFLARCPSSYVVGATPWLLHKQMGMYNQVVGTDDVAVDVSRYAGAAAAGAENALLTLALPETTPRAAITRATTLLTLHGLELQRAQVDTIAGDGGGSSVTLLRTVVRPLDGDFLDFEAVALVRDAARLKWVDDKCLQLASGTSLDLLEAEVASGLADLSLAVLDHPLLSRNHVHERLLSREVSEVAGTLARLVLARFDPAAPLAEERYDVQLADALKV